jgi:signal transduction histidine kinase
MSSPARAGPRSTGAHLARKRGEPVPEALLAIRDATSDATRELRTLLEVLRRPDAADRNTAASGLDQLGDLLERMRAGGVPATLTVRGEQGRLPPDVDRAAYRIVQEALTNVGRHAAAAPATVVLDYRPGELIVQDDDGRAHPDAPPVPGTGFIGMRERVAGLGGRLIAAPRRQGGFRARAELPVTAPAEASQRRPDDDAEATHRRAGDAAEAASP